MKKIVYFGMGFLPDKNAVANRELVMAKLIEEAGYIPVLIGINRNIKLGHFEKLEINGMRCYEVCYPVTIKQKIIDNYSFVKTMKDILLDINLNEIKCFIMQDYQIRPMKLLNKFLKRNNINLIPDIMDWFSPTSDSSVFKNVFKSIDTIFRMYLFYPRLDYRICISYSFQKYFQNLNKDSVVIPCTCLSDNIQTKEIRKTNKDKKLFFAGNPGIRFDKEKIDWVIKALYENNSNMQVYIYGIDYEQAIKHNPIIQKYITKNIVFLGHRPRKECLEKLNECDFSLVIRKKNKLSIYGLSSKISESFMSQIPVLATCVGDNPYYIKDGVNGYLADCSYESVKELLKSVEELDNQDILEMKKNLKEKNPLCYENYIQSFSKLIERL